MEKITDFLKIIEILNVNEPNFYKLSYTEKSKVFTKLNNTSKGSFSFKFFQKEYTYKLFLVDLAKAIHAGLIKKETSLNEENLEINQIILKFLDVKDLSIIDNKEESNIKPAVSFEFVDYTQLTKYLIFMNKILEDDKESPEIINNSLNLGTPTAIMIKKLITFKNELDLTKVKSFMNILIKNLLNFMDGILSDKYLFGVNEMIKDNSFDQLFDLIDIANEKWIQEKLLFIIEKFARISSNHSLNKTIIKYLDDHACLDKVWNSVLKENVGINETINGIKSCLQLCGLFSPASIITLNAMKKVNFC